MMNRLHGIQIFQLFAILLSTRILLIHAKATGESWSRSQSEEKCINPLGMESEKIPSSRITASSSFDVKSTGPQNARIRQELNGGAWCPRSTIEKHVKEYLEIDFDGNHRITQTETQGRFGNGMGQEFAEKFQLEYWREDLGKWISYKDHLGRTILDANSNTYIGVVQELLPPIVASKIRFIPYSIHPRTICMRVEAYGCSYQDGVIHYECPQGYWKKNPDVDLRDGFYDGWMDDEEILRGGLGLLTDSLLGPSDFRTQNKNKGNMWIGWDNELDPIKIGFQFDKLRKFHQVSVHVNNLVSQGVQIFASVDIYFSVDGQKFTEVPLRWIPKGTDLEPETAQLVNIPLKGRLATSIRLEFFHSNHWLLLSEIFFKSDIYTGNITDDILSLNFLQDGPEDEEIIDRGHFKNVTSDSSSDGLRNTTDESESNSTIVGLIIGSIVLFSLVGLGVVVCYVFRKGRRTTKLGGVMGLTPKSMSIGLGNGNMNGPDSLSTFGTSTNKLVGTGSSKSNSYHKNCKIPLNDFSRAGLHFEPTRPTDSDESFYHELVFRSFGSPYGDGELGVGDENGPFSRNTLFNKSNGSSSTTTSNLTCQDTTGIGKKNTGSRKIKYQRVNHGGDFNDYLRSSHDELSSNSNYFQTSQPSTPILSSKEVIPISTVATRHHLIQPILPPPPPVNFNTRGSTLKSTSILNNNIAHPGPNSVFTTKSSGSASSLGVSNGPNSLNYFNCNSPLSGRTKNRIVTNSIKHNGNGGSNYYAATDIFHHGSNASANGTSKGISNLHFERF